MSTKSKIKIRFGHYWIELFSSLHIDALKKALAETRMKIRWNSQLQDCTGRKGFLEVYHDSTN